MRPLLITLSLLVAAPAIASDSLVESFFQANQAYENGKHTTAIELYQRLADSPEISNAGRAQVQYNLGNAHLRAGQLGPAIAAYLRSYGENPTDQDLLANLTFARSQTQDDIQATPVNPIVKTLFFWHFSLGKSQLLGWLGLASVLLWGLLIVQLYWRHDMLRWARNLALLMFIALGSSALLREISPTRTAVVQPAEASVYSGQDSRSVVRFKLHEGTEMSVVQLDGEWVKVSLPDQKQGWLPAAAVEVVEL